MLSNKTTREGLFFLLGGAVCIAALPIWMKILYRITEIKPIEVSGWRFLIAVPALWAFIHIRQHVSHHEPMTADQKVPRLKLMLLGTMTAIGSTCVAYGTSYIDASVYTILVRTQPIMVLMITAFMGKRVPIQGWIALTLVMMGVVMMQPQVLALDLHGVALYGALIALLNAFAAAVNVLGQSFLVEENMSKTHATAWAVTGTLAALTPVLIWQGVTLPTELRIWGVLFGLSVLSTAVPFVAFYEAVSRLGAANVSLMISITPVMTMVYAFFLLGERLLPIQIMGSAFILGSLFVLQLKLPSVMRRRKVLPVPSAGD